MKDRADAFGRRFGEAMADYVARYERGKVWKARGLPKPPASLSGIYAKMTGTSGVIKDIADACGLDRTVMREVFATYHVMQEALDAVREEFTDDVESRFLSKVQQGDDKSVKTFLDTRMYDRGYNAKSAGKSSPKDDGGVKKSMTPRDRVRALQAAIDASQMAEVEEESPEG